jgi:hypothetical protein
LAGAGIATLALVLARGEDATVPNHRGLEAEAATEGPTPDRPNELTNGLKYFEPMSPANSSTTPAAPQTSAALQQTTTIQAAPPPLAVISSYREELGYSGPDAAMRFLRFVDTLRADREASAAYLHQELELLSPQEQLGDGGRRIAYLLGHIAHKSSIPHLSMLIELEVPQSAHQDDCGHSDISATTKSFAAYALDMIATRYHSPDTVIPVAELLEDVLRDPAQSPHLKVSAATILLAHTDDPAGRAKEFAKWMGQDAYLLDLQVVNHSSEVIR